MENERGILISFEGSEGSGKTTQISRISTRFEDAGMDVIVTREPGGTEIGEQVRYLLQHAKEGDNMFPETELLLFAASRAQLVREVILPNLDAGKIVLCDRFLDSTTVYQGVARKISSDPVQQINDFAVGDLMPDLTIVLDVPAEVSLERVKHRASALPDRMERENIDFYQSVREGYKILSQSMPERFLVFDGTRERKELEDAIWDGLSKRFS